MKTALVTGHLGFVGRHVYEALVGDGYEVLGLDIRHPVTPWDIRDWMHPSRQRDAASPTAFRFDLVVHCAAVVGGRTMIDGEPLRLACEDLSIDAALFSWALRTRPGRIVYFSSSAAYPAWLQGEGLGVRLGEDWINPGSSGMPDQTYGWVKLTGERLAEEANREGIRTHVFRPFSGYGADQDLDYPFPAIIGRAMMQDPREPFVVWGDPRSARDWVHIDDVVGCVMAAIEADDIGPMNICTGVATTFEDLATMALNELGMNPEIVGNRSKPAGVFWRVGDPLRMSQTYVPTVTVAEGVRRALYD